MSCHPVSSKQRDYAEALVGWLEESQHKSAARYKSKVEACDCIKEISKLIDKMIEARKGIQDANQAVRGQ